MGVELQDLLTFVPDNMRAKRVADPVVSKILAAKIGSETKYPALLKSIKELDEDWARSLRLFLPEVPQDVHFIGRGSGALLDLRGADEVASSVERAGFAFEPNAAYLDFGCSSGRTVRTLAAAFPKSRWLGVDPVARSIEWASSAFPYIEFSASQEQPPLHFAGGSLDGVYAISVWSHFREDMAVQWFNEMHRVIRPHGFLYFTTPSYRKFLNIAAKRDGEYPVSKLEDLFKSGFVFRQLPSANRGLDHGFWGEAHIAVHWVAANLLDKWEMRHYVPAGHQNQQDIYVLERRA